jgi:hypothetical protein
VYVLDPYYAVWDQAAQAYLAPHVDYDLFAEACELVKRAGGAAAELQLRNLWMSSLDILRAHLMVLSNA